MKYSLLVLLALTGCYHATWTQVPPPPPGPTVMGWSADHKIGYSCEQQNVNSALVWVACDFHNFSKHTDSVCIRVAYNKNGKEVTHSRKVCSNLAGDQVEQNFAAFTKESRNILAHSCGSNLGLCTLSTQLIQDDQ
jgi:hypothetical protein